MPAAEVTLRDRARSLCKESQRTTELFGEHDGESQRSE